VNGSCTILNNIPGERHLEQKMKIEFLDIRHRFGVKNFKVYVAFIIVTV
jgi:hypothetical protein